MSDNARPPYVTFEYRPVEDREASIVAGHFVAKDVIYALITPAGTKDVIEKEAAAWLKDMQEMAKQERIPAAWPIHYKEALDSWIKTQEIPETGTPLKNWPLLSPAQLRNVLSANIRTVEDLAEATEEALGRIGMGAQALKAKAKAWLDSAETKGKPAAELDSLRKQLENQEKLIENQSKQIRELKASLKKSEKAA